ncbi:hypothetical protein CR513_09610, partial [Mucuna pruriens]
MDVHNAFLHEDLEEKYLGFDVSKPRMLSHALKTCGFKQSLPDYSLFVVHKLGVQIVVLVNSIFSWRGGSMVVPTSIFYAKENMFWISMVKLNYLGPRKLSHSWIKIIIWLLVMNTSFKFRAISTSSDLIFKKESRTRNLIAQEYQLNFILVVIFLLTRQSIVVSLHDYYNLGIEMVEEHIELFRNPSSYPIRLYYDSHVVLHIAKNHIFHEYSKYIKENCHFVKMKFLMNIISSYIYTSV